MTRLVPGPMPAKPAPLDDRVWLYPDAPERVVRLSAVRSTLVAAGAVSLRALGLHDRYLEHLPAEHRASLTVTVAGSWVPLERMMVHYAACDALGIPQEKVLEIGRSIGSTMQEMWVAIIKTIASGTGVTPWSALDQYGRFWSRLFIGGGVSIARHGPKDAVLAIREFPVARFAYLRGSFCGVHERILGLFCTRVYARIAPGSLTPDGFDLRLAWA